MFGLVDGHSLEGADRLYPKPDGLAALGDLANPGLLPVLAISAGGWWLLWLRRRRA